MKVTELPKPEGLFLHVAAGDETLFLTGGMELASSTDGTTFHRTELTLVAHALWSVGARVTVVGSPTNVAHSVDGGRTFAPVALPLAKSLPRSWGLQGLRAIAEHADGSLWVGGDDGILLTGTTRKLALVKGTGAKERVTCLAAVGDAMFVGTNRAAAYLATRGKLAKCKLATKGPMYGVAVTRTGGVVVVGDGAPLGPGRKTALGVALRSSDGGATFQPAKVPKGPPLNAVVALPDGTIVACGDKGTLLASTDDGRSFSAISHDLEAQGAFDSAVVFRGAAYATGPTRELARIE